MTLKSNARLLLCALAVLLAGCGQKEADGGAEFSPERAALAEADIRVPVKGQAAVLFGHGYNDQEFVAETTAYLEGRLAEWFDLEGEPGFILPLVFPQDFTYGRISLLYDRLEEAQREQQRQMAGLIILGAPERTHAVLARLQDNWDMAGGRYPVIALSHQDDPLGIQSGCDLVLDIAGTLAGELGEEQMVQRPGEAPEIIGALARWLYTLQGTGETLRPGDDAEALFGADWNIQPYVDPETGLFAENHFVLERR